MGVTSLPNSQEQGDLERRFQELQQNVNSVIVGVRTLYQELQKVQGILPLLFLSHQENPSALNKLQSLEGQVDALNQVVSGLSARIMPLQILPHEARLQRINRPQLQYLPEIYIQTLSRAAELESAGFPAFKQFVETPLWHEVAQSICNIQTDPDFTYLDLLPQVSDDLGDAAQVLEDHAQKFQQLKAQEVRQY